MLTIGTTIAGWTIVRELHQGSMAVTFEVSHATQPGRFALKLMYLRDPSFRERLRRVGAAQKGLSHPHLIDVVDVIDVEGAPGVVSRFIAGTDLGAWSAAEKRPLPQVMDVFRQLVDGLVTAHERGLIHRNLKPQKVIIDRSGAPHVHDFMLGKVLDSDTKAAVTQMGTTFGTPQYMSPEQFRGAADVDARTDLFSLGCLLFELLTGRRAFDGNGLMDIYKQISEGNSPPPSSLRPEVPPELDRLVADLLAVDRDARPQSARVVAERLDKEPALRALRNLPVLDAPPPPSGTTPPPPPRAKQPPRHRAGETIMPLEGMQDDDSEEAPLRPPSRLGSIDITEEVSSGKLHTVSPRDPTPAPVPPPPLADADDSAVRMGVLLVLCGAAAMAIAVLVVMWLR